jgi:stearoyl-CoA desaturase (delta-9 desaturase)
MAHKAIEFHPVIAHFMRFWLWLTTGMVTKEWVAVHRKHHAFCETKQDPHSPHIYGIWRVLFGGAILYNQAATNTKMINSFGVGTPEDAVEKFYTKYHWLGILILLVINILIFQWIGIIIWIIQIIWIPFWAAGVVNGLGHWFGYRNGNTKDKSTNLIPIGVIIGGEELHNNHHLNPSKAKLSLRKWEFDIGWMWLSILKWLKLANIK